MRGLRTAMSAPLWRPPLWRRVFSASPAAADAGASLGRMTTTVAQLLRQLSFKKRRVEVRRGGDATLRDVLDVLNEQNASSLLLYYEDKTLLGLVTARDILRALGKTDAQMQEAPLAVPLEEVATPADSLVYAKATDSLARCHIIMSERRIRNLPVVHDNTIVGLITAKDLMDYSYDPQQLGGKASFIRHIAGRRGLPPNVRVAVDAEEERAEVSPDAKESMFLSFLGAPQKTQMDMVPPRIYVQAAAVMLPHPFKKADGFVGESLRDHGPDDFATDPALSDDAYFLLHKLKCPHGYGDEVTVVGIADGVGEWRLKGYDSGAFAQTFMDTSREIVEGIAANLESQRQAGEPLYPNYPIRPMEILQAGWASTMEKRVPGSATALIATVDTELSQLSFSNVGDAGIVILRHIDSTVAGYMRDHTTPRHMRKGDLRLAFQSQQQLKSFNLPYQFGYEPEELGGKLRFETPRHADTTSVPVMPGDTIVIATDGLFDNVELEEIGAIVLAWEKRRFGARQDLADAGTLLDEVPVEAVEELATELCQVARRHAVDSTRDGPFAMLAKENDIMWSGGKKPCYFAVELHRLF